MTILDRLIKNLSRLPGIGSKSASRIAYFLLTADATYTESLSRDIHEVKSKIKHCSTCGNYTEDEVCHICANPSRDHRVICVVEESKDIISIESVHDFTGVYHVLMGTISPINGIGPDSLNIMSLIKRIEKDHVEELIIAINPTVEGDTTAHYIASLLKGMEIKITRLAMGLPVGGDLEYTDKLTIARAFQGRTSL